MSLYPQDILDQVLGRIDIAELIGSYLPLKKAGRNFKACCPFHHEKTASFMVSTDKQIYHCFGCGAGGNAFNFLMQYERMEFPEAVEMLARKAGIVLPVKRKSAPGQPAAGAQALYKINELAARYFRKNLTSPAGIPAQRYLQKRRIGPRTAAAFNIGLALSSWDGLLSFAGREGITESLLEKAGLVLRNQENRLYDRFRNRLIFPIVDPRSAVVAFGGRVLDDSLPKYINSPETPVYVKGRMVFGLNCAKEHIRRQDRVVIVEGYLDCIVPSQEGVQNIVASLGTALTVDQIRLLKRYTRNMVLVYDGDAAGQSATLRSLDLFLEEGLLPQVAALPSGYDPDSYVIKHGIQGFRSLLEGADTLFEYKLRVLSARHNLSAPEGKAAISDEMLEMIAKVDNQVLRSEYIRRLAEHLGVAEQHFYTQLKSPAARNRVMAAVNSGGDGPDGELRVNPCEKLLLQMLLRESEYISLVRDQLTAGDFQDGRVSKVIDLIYELFSAQKSVEASRLLDRVDDQQVRRLICSASLETPEAGSADSRLVIDDCIKRIKHRCLKERQHRLHQEIKKAQDSHDSARLRALMEEFHILVKRGN